jgi:hypothetical protein
MGWFIIYFLLFFILLLQFVKLLMLCNIYYLYAPCINQFSGELSYEVKDPAYCYMILKRPDDLNALSEKVTKWLSEVENSKVVNSFLSFFFWKRESPSLYSNWCIRLFYWIIQAFISTWHSAFSNIYYLSYSN